MSPPARCFSCGSIIGDKWETYVILLQEGHSEKEAIKKLELPMWCCNRMLFTHMPMVDQLLVRRAVEGRSIKHTTEAGSGGRMDGRDEGDDCGGGGDD